MNNYYDRLGFLAGLTVTILAAQPSLAAQRQITGIDINSTKHNLELKLATNTKESNASFFTIRRGNIIEANLLNTELKLPHKSNFKQNNPLPGIKTVEINSVDREHTKISITIEPGVEVEDILEQQGRDILLSLNEPTSTQKFYKGLQKLSSNAIDNFQKTYRNALASNRTKNEKKPSVKNEVNRSNNDVLIPNPDIVITNKDGSPTIANSSDTYSQAAPTRAVAPPVGDMAVSNINAEPDTIDLGSEALVPRLVLRDAPVREVLSLLARSAGLNIVFASNNGAPGGGQGGNNSGAEEPTISLDLENQPVQEVFNSVLLMSNLNANRQGNIVYVGEKLPAQARNLVSRTLRLNQVRAENAALFLATQGATGQRLTTEVEETIDPETGKVAQRIEKPATLEELSNPGEDGENNAKALLLKGLQVSTDDRLNSITLVGEPRKVEVAVAFLTQLDARRRQVAVNVKVIDINLLNTDSANSSFSFGVNDTFFLQDRGSAVLNFGGENPRVSDTLTFRRSGDETTRFESIPEGPRREIGIPQASDLPRKFLALLESNITTGNAKVLTDPTLIVQEGQQATVKLTQEIVQSVTTEIDGDSGTRTVTPEIGEAGLTLAVDIERIDDNGFISLSVSPKISSVGGTQSFDSGGGAINTLNLLSTRETNSGLIRLKDSQTLILSGIIQDQERTNITKVPILGDIPLLGALFRSSEKTNERAEVIVLLTPEIVDEQSDFGYDYTPGKESREVLEKSGVQLPGNP